VPDHRVDQDAVARAEERVDAGTYDEETGWSHAAPSADRLLQRLDARRDGCRLGASGAPGSGP
jgi:hypothetical protein